MRCRKGRGGEGDGGMMEGRLMERMKEGMMEGMEE